MLSCNVSTSVCFNYMVENVSFHVCCIILKKREMMSLDNVISSYLPMFDCKN